jgi:hypothetical protein
VRVSNGRGAEGRSQPAAFRIDPMSGDLGEV